MATYANPATLNEPTTLQTVWGYLRSELLYLAWALTEIAFIVPISLTFMGWARYWPVGQVALWALLLLLLPFNLIRLMTLLQLPAKRQQTMMAFLLFVTLFFSLRILVHPNEPFFGWISTFFRQLGDPDNRTWARDLYTFALVSFLWWRGIRLVNLDFDIQRIGSRLRVGGLLLAPITIGLVRDYLLWDVTPFLLLFFAAALTAVSLIRVEQIEQEHSGQAAPITWHWFFTITLVIFNVIFTAGVVATLISGQATDSVIGWLTPFWQALHFASTIIIILVSYLFVPIMIALTWLINLMLSLIARIAQGASDLLPENFIEESAFGSLIQQLQQIDETAAVDPTQPGFSTRLIVILIMIAIILIVALTLTRLYQRTDAAQREAITANKTAVPPTESPSLAQQLLAKLGLLPRWRTAASIRRTYAQMCRAAAAVGHPRTTAETPYEYLSSLNKVWPTKTAETERITQAYIRIRYGELPESKAELDAILQAWHTLKETMPM